MSTIQITPDGARYLTERPPSPFHLRILLPWLCRDDLIRWRIAAWAGVAATLTGTVILAPDWRQGLAAALIVAGLPMVRFNLANPVLVDSAALGLATLSAAAWVSGWHAPAVLLALAAGAAKEPAPLFAAVFAWSPILLIGMAIPLLVKVWRKPGDDVLDEHHAWILAHPIAASRKYHAGFLTNVDPRLVVPWGACVVALAAPSWQLAAALTLAYAQVAVATDTVRLYQWAAPVVAIAATTAVPPQWWPVLAVAVWFNPLRGNGV